MSASTDAATNPRVAEAMTRVTAALAGPGSLSEKLGTMDSVTLLLGAIGSAELLVALLVEGEEEYAVAKGASAMVAVVLERVCPGWAST